MMICYVILASVCVAAYSNVFYAPYLHDDFPAIVNNPDVKNDSSITDLLCNDYWGTPMFSSQSHKSYRPITVLTFRSARQLFGNNPSSQHIINIVCHVIVTLLFYQFCGKHVFLNQPFCSLLAGILFGTHPIHTEAVSNIVGRAELLCAIFFLASILLYNKSYYHQLHLEGVGNVTENGNEETWHNHYNKGDEGVLLRKRKGRESNEKSDTIIVKEQCSCSNMKLENWLWFFLVLVLGSLAMLSKETGITVFGVLILLEIFNNINKKDFNKHFQDWKLVQRICLIVLWSIILLVFRLWIMDWSQPTFAEQDNPASFHKSFKARSITYIYIYWVNLKLLICPVGLCYDWSYGTIPIITTLFDGRNLYSIFLCFVLCLLFFNCVYLHTKKCALLRCYFIGTTLLLPFLPASNLFFRVGFVVAERVLYLPSMGFVVIIVALYHHVQLSFPKFKTLLTSVVLMYVGFYFYQTFTRNFDWTSKQALFSSGVKTAPHNAKVRYNWANYLRANGRPSEAVTEYEKALDLYPSYVSAINNLATVLEDDPSTKLRAEKLYARVIQIQPLHSNAYNNLAHLLIERGQYKSAVRVLLRAISSTDGQLRHAGNLADLLDSHNKTNHADTIYENILEVVCETWNCKAEKWGVQEQYAGFLLKHGRLLESEKLFRQTFEESRSCNSLVGLSQVLLGQNKIEQASNVMLRAVELDSNKVFDLWKLAAQLFQRQLFKESLKLYTTVITFLPENADAKGQYAAVMSQLGRRDEAERILLALLGEKEGCQTMGTWKNLATLYGMEGKHEQAVALLTSCEEKIIEDKASLAILLHEKAKHLRDLSKIALKEKKQKEGILKKELSIKNLKSAISINPNFTEAKELLSILSK